MTLPTTLAARDPDRPDRDDPGDETRLDALMVQPLVTRLVLGGDGHGTALLRSAATSTRHQAVTVPGRGKADVRSYDGRGTLLTTTGRRPLGAVRCPGRTRPPLTSDPGRRCPPPHRHNVDPDRKRIP